MAIASVVVQTLTADAEGVLTSLRSSPAVLQAVEASPGRIAAGVETPADSLLKVLRDLERLPGVVQLELVFVNYEDDMDENGFIECGDMEALRKQLKKAT